MKRLFLAVAIMTSFFNLQAIFWNDLSREDMDQLSEITQNVETIQTHEKETQEAVEEWRDYLEEHQDHIKSLITQINDLIRKYPNKHHLIKNFSEQRDYLQDLVVNYEL